MTKLYIIRHGETEWNKEHRTQGCGNDLPLCQEGITQARAVSRRFIGKSIHHIYSSDLRRAYETAAEISKITSRPVITSPGLRELNFGCWEGLTTDDIKTRYKDMLEIWRTNPLDCCIPQAETLIMLQKRAIDTVDEIIRNHKGKNIVIVSHGITIKVMILGILGMDISKHSSIKISNTGVSIIEWNDNGPALTLFNDTCHIA